MHRRTLLATAASATASALAAPAIAQPPRTLRFVPQTSLTALDPIWTTASVTTGHAYHVFDTLYGVDKSLTPQPQMAEGHTTSDDGRTWTIRLRDNLKFHDNTPVLARDCTASLARWAKRDSFGQVLAKAVDAWEAPDDRTIRIKLTKPFPPLLAALSKPTSLVPFIMPERLARTDAATQVTEMVGSGPYRFLKDEFVSGSRVAYARFDGYVPRPEPAQFTAGGKRPLMDRVEWQVIPDAATAAAALRNNEVDWWEYALPDLVPNLTRTGAITVKSGDPLGYISILRFNSLVPPFDNKALRLAVLAGIDQADYMRAINGDNVRWRTCAAAFPCGAPFINEVPGILRSPPDLARARDAVKAAGYKGETIVIINPGDFPSIGPLGEVTADMLRRLGMNVDLQTMDWGTVGQRRTSKAPATAGGWNIFHTWTPGVSITNPALNYYIRGQGQAGWFGWYDDPRIEQLTEDWLTAPTETQSQVFDAIQKQAFANAPMIPLGQYFPPTAYRNTITGVLDGTNCYPWNVSRV